MDSGDVENAGVSPRVIVRGKVARSPRRPVAGRGAVHVLGLAVRREVGAGVLDRAVRVEEAAADDSDARVGELGQHRVEPAGQRHDVVVQQQDELAGLGRERTAAAGYGVAGTAPLPRAAWQG